MRPELRDVRPLVVEVPAGGRTVVCTAIEVGNIEKASRGEDYMGEVQRDSSS